MPKPIFLRDEAGKIKKVIRPGDRRKKSTGLKSGHNAAKPGSGEVGFQPTTPVTPTVPTVAPHFPDGTLVTKENRGFEGGNWEAQHAKMTQVIKNKEEQSLDALVAYEEQARTYSNSITSEEHEPLNPEAQVNYDLTREAY